MKVPKKIYTQEKGEYLKNNPTWHVEDSAWKAKQVYKIIDKNKLKPNNIVEIGCGAGEILNQLHKLLPNHINYTGYDISIDAIKLAKTRELERLNYIHNDILNIENKFDLSLVIDVFEHVEDYFSFLRSIKTKSNYTIFHIPLDINILGTLKNAQIKQRNNVGHLHFFTKDTALESLKDCNYEVLDYCYTKGALDLSKSYNVFSNLFRRILYKVNKDIAVRLLGGFSLLVLTKNE